MAIFFISFLIETKCKHKYFLNHIIYTFIFAPQKPIRATSTVVLMAGLAWKQTLGLIVYAPQSGLVTTAAVKVAPIYFSQLNSGASRAGDAGLGRGRNQVFHIFVRYFFH